MQKTFHKLMVYISLVAICFSNAMPVVYAATIGEIRNDTVTAGKFEKESDVLVTKTATKVDDNGKYHINFNVKGKKATKTTSHDLYVAVVFDTSGSMICDNDNGGYSQLHGRYDYSNAHYTAADGVSIDCKDRFGWNKADTLTKAKWESAVNGGIDFSTTLLSKVPNANLSLITFATNVSTATDWSSSAFTASQFGHPYGGTNLSDAITRAEQKLNTATSTTGNPVKKIMVVIGDGEPNSESAAKTAANNAKDNGITIYSIGYEADSYATRVLQEIASGSDYYSAANSNGIVQTLEQLASTISTRNAGSKAVLTDTIAPNFTHVDGNDTNGVSVDGKKVTYNIGDITEEGTDFGFDIQIDTNSATGWYETNTFLNNGVILTYTDANGEVKELPFYSSPEVYWVCPEYQYVVNYYKDEVSSDNYLGNSTNKASYNSVIYESDVDKTLYLPDGYKFDTISNTPLTISDDENSNVINVIYKKRTDLSYRVEYYYDDEIDEDSTDNFYGQTFGDIIRRYNDKNRDGYRFERDFNVPLTIGTDLDSNVIKVCYVKRTDLSYVVNYLEEGTDKKLADSKTVTNQTFKDKVTESPIDIDGYEKLDSDKTIEITTGNNVINFYYKKRSNLSYVVNYLEKGTNEKLADSKTVTNQTFMDKVTESPIDIDGYEKLDSDKTIEITTGNNVINFYYKKRSNLSYVVNYLEKGTNKKLADSKTVNNKTFKDKVTESPIDIDGYKKLDSDKTIEIATGNNVINFYYSKRNDLSYRVEYYYDGTIDNDLTDNFYDQTFGDIIRRYDDKNRVGYRFDIDFNVPLTIGTDLDSNVIKVCYVKRTDLSYIVNYLEEGTDEKLADSNTVTDQTFGDKITESPIDIDGYEKLDGDKTIEISVEGNVINFYYKKIVVIDDEYVEIPDTKVSKKENNSNLLYLSIVLINLGGAIVLIKRNI